MPGLYCLGIFYIVFMETKNIGYKQKQFAVPTKRYCQALDLMDDQELIRKYIEAHSEENIWPEIIEGIRSVGILEMEIYNINNQLFMIIETPVDFDWDEAFAGLSKLPRQEEWEAYVSILQGFSSTATSTEKWRLMDRIFHLPTT